MAENKKSFLLYCDIVHTVKKLNDEQAGKLLKIILSYVNDENPTVEDILIDLVFEPIKQQLKRDLKHWELVTEKRKESGRMGGIKSGETRKNEANEANASTVKQNEANEAVIVTVNDNVNGNVTDTVNDIKKKSKEDADFLSKIIEGFQKSYIEIFGSDYVLMAKGKERAAASKILQLYKTKYPDADSEKTISELTTFFKNCCMIDDNWIQKNMSLPIIVSKFNEINNKLKNGSKKNQRVTPESIERLTELATATQSRYGQ